MEKSTMHLPTNSELVEPTFLALKALGGSGNAGDIRNQVVRILCLPASIVALKHNGKANMDELSYRLTWARQYLKKSGIIDVTSQNVWYITDPFVGLETVDVDEICRHYKSINWGGGIMINLNSIFKETQTVLSTIDKYEFPETYEYLESIIDDDGLLEDDTYTIAGILIESDKPKTFPQLIIQYIFLLYTQSIARGNAMAMNDLGAQYYGGYRGFEQSFKKAVYYYDMAAANGNRQAQENLGYCYYYGRDVEQDYEKAFQYFALGALDGHLTSLYKIGDMYLNGYYVKKNEKEAFFLYNRCLATMTENDARFVAGPVHLRMGDMCLDGIGIEKDTETALAHYQAAERYLYKMVNDGEIMYKKSLQRAIEGQERARKILLKALPEDEWKHD